MVRLLETEFLSAIASVLAALCAAVAILVALSANRTSRRALALAKRQAMNQEAPLVLHVIDVFATVSDAGDRDIVVSVLVTNPSTMPSAIARAELQIDHVAGDRLIHLLLQTSDRASPPASGPIAQSGDGAVHFEPNGAATIDFAFHLPAAVVDVQSIRRYSLRLTDSQGQVQSAPPALVKEIRAS